MNETVSLFADPKRIAALNSTGLLDSAPEEAFDRITRLVSHLLDTPMSLVSLVDADRQFLKSARGLPEPIASQRQLPLSHSFCKHVVIADAPLVVMDATRHPLVSDNPAITEFGMIAYLGAPIRTGDGQVIGSLCAIDVKPRQWNDSELTALLDIAEILKSEIELRREIEERRRAENQQQLLIRELNHRVRNTLATVQSVVQLSLRSSRNIEVIKQSVSARIGALARAHTMLTDAQWTSASIHDIIRGELAPYHAEDRVTLDGPAIRLPSDNAVTFAMVMHELATNASKYGSLSSEQGRIDLRWVSEPGDGDGTLLTMDWVESEGPRVAKPKREGFGTSLLQRLMTGNFNGDIQFDYDPKGLRVHLVATL